MMKFRQKAGLLLSAACLALATTATAQSKFYVGAQIGYGIPANSDVLGLKGNDNKLENSVGTIGGGLTAGINLGYNITEYLSFDLGGQYLLGSQVTESDITGPNGMHLKEEMKTNQFRLIPSLIIKTGEGKVKPFARFGLVIPVAGKTVREHSSYDATPEAFHIPVPGTMAQQNYTYEFKGAVSLGFDAGLGIAYELSENICMTAELNYTSLRIKTKSGTMTAYKADIDLGGTNIATLGMNDLPTLMKEINFVDEINSNSNNRELGTNINRDQAEDQLARRTNFNSFGLKLGIKYGF